MEIIFIHAVFSLILGISFTLSLYNIDTFKLKLNELLTYASLIFCIFFINSFKSNFLIIPLILICTNGYLYFKYKECIKSIITIISSIIIFIISDAISGSFIVCILKYKYNDLSKNNLPSWALYIFTFLLSFILSKLAGYIYNKFYSKNQSNNKKSSLSTILVVNIIAVCFILYLYGIINRSLMPALGKTYIITSLLLFSIYFISSFIFLFIYANNMKKQFEYEARKNEYSQLKEYTQVIEQTLNDIKCFKHDYANILSAINGYIENDDMIGLRDFYNNNLNTLSKAFLNKNNNITNLKYLKIPPLKGLLSSKVLKANSLNIKTTVGLLEDIDDIPIDIIDLTRIVGVLFDNAIEAASSCDNPKIDFGIIKKKGNTVIFISNTCPPDTPPINQIYKKGFSTKGKNRGLGLYTLKSIIDKNYKNATINTSIENHFFKQVLCISPVMSNIKDYQKAI